MDQDSKYSLEFENHKNNLCNNLTRYFNRKTFVNVTLICNGEAVTAHQVVLSAGSQLFEDILMARSEPHPVLIFADIPRNHMEFLVEFMYEGQISISKKLLPSLLKTAKKLQIRGLNYEKFDDVQTNVDTTQNLSPVLIETLQQNSTVEDQNIEAQNLVNDEAPRWLTSKTSLIKTEVPGKKVINPFAVKSKSFSDSDSTIFEYDIDAPGPSKKKFKKHVSRTEFSLLENDSDVEFVDNRPSIVVITDTQDNNSNIRRRDQKYVRPVKASAEFSEVEFTSDESDIITSSPKKLKRNAIASNSEDDSSVKPSVLVNPAALKDKSNDENVKDNSGSSKMNGKELAKPSVTIKKNDSAKPNESITKPTLNGDCNVSWRPEKIEEPFEGYCTSSFDRLRNFCVICQKYKSHCRNHIQKCHNIASRGKTFSCQICSKKFSRKRPLEIHKCEFVKGKELK